MTKFNGNVQSILNYIAQYDKAGKSTAQIDTFLEFDILGEYLNGNKNIDGVSRYDDLKKSEKKDLQQIYSNTKSKLMAALLSNNDGVFNITTENASEYAARCRHYQQLLFGGEELSEDDAKIFENLGNSLYKFCLDSGKDLDQGFVYDYNYDFIVRNILEGQKINKANAKQAVKSLTLIKTPYDAAKLKGSVQKYVNDGYQSFISTIPQDVDLGNGEFDRAATQKTNVCWAIAAINSLVQTEQGKLLLESNRYYDENTGIFAIHLQEAEDNGFHDGIYIITPEDIINESSNLSEGEGDVTAYLIAVSRYFEEVRSNNELKEKLEAVDKFVSNDDYGNEGDRFFEVLTGGSSVKYSTLDSVFYNVKPQDGIGSVEIDEDTYQEIYNIAASGNGAVTLAVSGREPHSVSVVGVRNGNLLIQESNNNPDFAKTYRYKEFEAFIPAESINEMPAYELPKDKFEGGIIARAYCLKW